jgi:hypothetical protein
MRKRIFRASTLFFVFALLFGLLWVRSIFVHDVFRWHLTQDGVSRSIRSVSSRLVYVGNDLTMPNAARFSPNSSTVADPLVSLYSDPDLTAYELTGTIWRRWGFGMMDWQGQWIVSIPFWAIVGPLTFLGTGAWHRERWRKQQTGFSVAVATHRNGDDETKADPALAAITVTRAPPRPTPPPRA